MAHGRMSKANLMMDPRFRWRGGEITRLEAFSDAVYAFAVTLLVVSLEVPHTFEELLGTMKGFVAFAACFAILILIWHAHVKFFRRYGLQDAWTVFLNSSLLFVVLLYVYPLKFLFFLVLGGAKIHIENEQVPVLMTIYGLGYAAVFLMFLLMYRHAIGKADQLELSLIERLETKHEQFNSGVLMAFGMVSAALANLLPLRLSGLAGWLFAFVGVYFGIAESIFAKKMAKLEIALLHEQSGATSSQS
jgi:uncharacterized membrane protein